MSGLFFRHPFVTARVGDSTICFWHIVGYADCMIVSCKGGFMRFLWFCLFLSVACVVAAQQLQQLPSSNVIAQALQEAPTGFDGKPNGLVDAATFAEDQKDFDGAEEIADGLGPLYNAQACRECHQNPISGGASQVTELRVGHRGRNGRFENPRIAIARGTETISGRSLVNDRAICPGGQYPDMEIQQRVPESETIRTLRLSLNVLGDGFVEAVADQTFVDLAQQQCARTGGKICGQVINVPVVEAPGETRVGRFGWKNQHASLLSFSADAYLNEMGITSRLQPDEVTNLCNTAATPNDTPGPDGLDGVDRFARFIRATKAPPRDAMLAATPHARRGSQLFDAIGCAICHVRTLATAPAGTKINGGAFTIPAALGGKTFHPFSDFLLHNVGTGDGIVQVVADADVGAMQPSPEHYGRRARSLRWRNFPDRDTASSTQYKLRTPPLWGVRLRTRLMHDGASLTYTDAILRHRGEASDVAARFERLPGADQEALLEFLRSL